jgi:isopenicillin N synthase-like dioxygenase
MQAIGHGISSSFLDEIRQVAREFFQQPTEEKKKYAKGVTDFEGYGADPVPEEGQPLDWSDRLFLDAYPEDRKKPKLWPESPPSFRCSTLSNYHPIYNIPLNFQLKQYSCSHGFFFFSSNV